MCISSFTHLILTALNKPSLILVGGWNFLSAAKALLCFSIIPYIVIAVTVKYYIWILCFYSSPVGFGPLKQTFFSVMIYLFNLTLRVKTKIFLSPFSGSKPVLAEYVCYYCCLGCLFVKCVCIVNEQCWLWCWCVVAHINRHWITSSVFPWTLSVWEFRE